MPTLVQIGAGNIGRGFIAPLFHAGGWSVIFVEVAAAMLAALRARGGYHVIAVDGVHEVPYTVSPTSAIDGRDSAAVIQALATADLVSVSVGLANLSRLGPTIAQALAQRSRPLDVLICENGAQAHELLRAAVVAAGGNGNRLGCVRTSIGRMIPTPTGGDDVLDIRVEPYCHLPVERAAFRGAPPLIKHLELADNFDLIIRQKLYLHNLTHAALAYGGQVRGCVTIPDCMEIPELAATAEAAGSETCAALAAAYGPAAGRASRELLDGLLKRYGNRALNDVVARVARDPWRKLAADDRLVGAAQFCLANGVTPAAISRVIGYACRYTALVDEPRASEWNILTPAQRFHQASALAAAHPLSALCGF